MSTDSQPGSALATKPGGALAAADDFFGTIDPSLLEAAEQNVRQEEIRHPRLALMQPMSPEITASQPGYNKGAIINNLTREVYTVKAPQPWLAVKGVPAAELKVVEACVMIPIIKLPDEFYKWKDRQTEGTGWHLKTLDQNHPEVIKGTYPPLGRWGEREEEKRKAPPITDNCNWLVMITGLEGNPLCEFIVITFAKTSRRSGRKFTQEATTWSRTNKRPTFYQTYILSSELQSKVNDKGATNTWYEYRTYPYKLLQELASRERVMGLHNQCMDIWKKCVDTTPVDPKTFDPTKPVSSTNLTQGRALQELIINSANLDESEGGGHDGGDAGDSGTGSDPAF